MFEKCGVIIYTKCFRLRQHVQFEGIVCKVRKVLYAGMEKIVSLEILCFL